MDADGVLHVTTPSGVTRTTRPPGMRPPRMFEPPEPTPETVTGSPSVMPDDDDPPPF